jgi:hypothetical protein
MALAVIQRGLMNPDECGLSDGDVQFLQQRCGEIESALGDLPH